MVFRGNIYIETDKIPHIVNRKLYGWISDLLNCKKKYLWIVTLVQQTQQLN